MNCIGTEAPEADKQDGIKSFSNGDLALKNFAAMQAVAAEENECRDSLSSEGLTLADSASIQAVGSDSVPKICEEQKFNNVDNIALSPKIERDQEPLNTCNDYEKEDRKPCLSKGLPPEQSQEEQRYIIGLIALSSTIERDIESKHHLSVFR